MASVLAWSWQGVTGWLRVNNSLGCSLFNQTVLRCWQELQYLTRHWKIHSREHVLKRFIVNVSTTGFQCNF